MCSFQEKRWDGNLTKDVSAQYKVKYINEKKRIGDDQLWKEKYRKCRRGC